MPTPPITFHRCEHIKVNGVQCGSPALRAKRRCFFHDHCAALNNKIQPELTAICSLEDANSIQLGIAEVIRMLLIKEVDATTASLLLRALRLAAANVKFISFEPKSAQVVVDPSAIDDRFANGPANFDPAYETTETPPQAIAVDNQSAENSAPNKAEPPMNGMPKYLKELIRRFHENSVQMRLFKNVTPSENTKLPASVKLPASPIEAPQHESNLQDSNFHDSNLQDAPATDLKIPDPSTFPNLEIARGAQETCQ